MESLANLESFVRSAELGGFSAAARRLGLTPAAVSRNVALLALPDVLAPIARDGLMQRLDASPGGAAGAAPAVRDI